MLKNNNKISVRQIIVIFFLSTISPGVRIFPPECSKYAKQAAWLTPFISALLLMILLSILNAFFASKRHKNLSDVFSAALGKVSGKVLLSIYLIWCAILFSIYIRYFAERFLGTIYPNTNIRFFVLTMLFVVYVAARGKIEHLARFSEFIFIFFLVTFIVLLLLILPEVKISNLFPITTYDILPVMRGSLVITAIWGYLLLPFFFGEKIVDMEKLKKTGKECVILLIFIPVLFLIAVIGSLSPSVTQKMSYAFYNAVKLISFIESLERFESLVLAYWIISDFILLSFLLTVMQAIIKNLFSLTEAKRFTTPLAAFGYVGSQVIAASIFELEEFSRSIAIYANIFFFFIVPLIILIIGKVRKTV